MIIELLIGVDDRPAVEVEEVEEVEEREGE